MTTLSVTGSPHLEPIGDPIWQLSKKGGGVKMEQAHAVHDVYNHKTYSTFLWCMVGSL